jgi:hypothetical protein
MIRVLNSIVKYSKNKSEFKIWGTLGCEYDHSILQRDAV